MSKQKVTGGISDREAEVLALVGQHLSNAEIGARLYISVRTVETHVSALLRKVGVPDRRALAGRAAESTRAEQVNESVAVLPAPLTSFIGRTGERAALRAAVTAHRQVTALGPGGVGKTRLALAVAADLAAEFTDGAWFVDLVPVTDPALIGSAVARALGLGEQHGQSLDDSVLTVLADRHTLLVLDNCEHLRDALAPFLERLLAHCPRVTVLVTSRARLLVPFEQVYEVPPTVLDGGNGPSDAVALFLERARALGRSIEPDRLDRVDEICRRLDGLALAIELAATRLPSLGLDGLTASLADPLRLLVGGRRADERHRSVRAMLDWSQTLLTDQDRLLLRRVAVFAAPFTAADATAVAGYPPLERNAIADGLARLAEQSLLTIVTTAGGTRYRALETIRQYATEQLTATGESAIAYAGHLDWCRVTATALVAELPSAAGWRSGFDTAIDDLRAALTWAADQSAYRSDAHELALSVARLTFARNLTGEAQLRYEQAAALTDDPAAAAATLRHAAAVAGCRTRGADMYRLYRTAAGTAYRGGDTAAAARDLATAAITVFRMSDTFAQAPAPGEAADLLAEARALAGDDPGAAAAVALAECGVFAHAADSAGREPQAGRPTAVDLAQRAVELAYRTEDRLARSAALDALAAAQCWVGDNFAAADTARRRVELLTGSPDTPAEVVEQVGALAEAAEICLGVGDLPGARRYGAHLRDLPILAERGDFATSRLLLADALAGHSGDVLAGSSRFIDAWELAGRPHAPHLTPAAAAVALIHGLRDDETARTRWLAIAAELGTASQHKTAYGAVFEAILLLHRGGAADAVAELATDLGDMDVRDVWVWRHWYYALRAEAAVLAGDPTAAEYLATAATVITGDPIAEAIVARAAALHAGDSERLAAAADAFATAGCLYQQARTLTLVGDDRAGEGVRTLRELGFAPAAG
ncbi:ATP-binding protein [Nocardia carnea]|uniref:ATP-binding protein n=1 Tax=Nocardia carnea TaxID=37328 RepID=UPI0024561F5F|nr:LuxR C-terminal-related transcriptional regulator [Nocardia carnea]